jgi:hypothetical protein
MNLIEIATITQERLDQANALIALRAEELETLKANHSAEIAGYKAEADKFSAYKSAMEAKVGAVLQSGDPAQYEALAKEFLTPAEELARQAILARIDQLEAEAAALKAEIPVE